MTERANDQYVLCLTAARAVNKRMALFVEGLREAGVAVRIAALPRGRWVLDKSERPTVVTRTGRWTADLGDPASCSLASVLCFHWFMLPMAIAVGWWNRVPVLYDEHDHYELNTLESGGPLWKRRLSALLVRVIHRVCLPWVTVVTCIHQHEQTLQRHLLRWQPRVMEVHNYPSETWLQAGRERQPRGPLCFVYIGGVFREKGVAAAADAFRMVRDRSDAAAELHVFGEGDAELIRQIREQPGVTVHNGVTPEMFRQFVSGRRCCGLALLADTPRYQLVGTNCTKLYEYLALGMPVIGSRVGEFPEQIEGQGVGLLIDAHLPADQLCDAMLEFLTQPDLFDRCSARALAVMHRPGMTWEDEWSRVLDTGALPGRRRAA